MRGRILAFPYFVHAFSYYSVVYNDNRPEGTATVEGVLPSKLHGYAKEAVGREGHRVLRGIGRL